MNGQIIILWWDAFRRTMNKKYRFSIHPRLYEAVALGVILSGSLSTYIFGMFLVLPELLGSYQSYLMFMQILGTWIFIAVLSNIYLIRKRTSSIWYRMLPQPVDPPVSPTHQLNSGKETTNIREHYTATPFGNKENWHICADCQIYVPPRTWHCKKCQTCILRRDHHCVFTGCCIGQENQSNFLGLIFYLGFGMTLSAIFSLAYHVYILDRNILNYLCRSSHIYLLYDFDLRYTLAGMSMGGQLLAWVMLLAFIRNALKGQTAADVHRKVYWTGSIPGCGRVSFENMRDFLGPQPILRILWPFHPPLKINYDIVRVGGEADDEDPKRNDEATEVCDGEPIDE